MSLIKGDACTATITIGATPYTIKGYEFTWQNGADEAEITHFGSTAGTKEWELGNEEWSGTIKGNLHSDDVAFYTAAVTPGTALTLELVVDAGVLEIAGPAKTVNFTIDRVSRRGDTITEYTLNYKGNGAYTLGAGTP